MADSDSDHDSDHSYFEPEWEHWDDVLMRMEIVATMDIVDLSEAERVDRIIQALPHRAAPRVSLEYRRTVDSVEAHMRDQPLPPPPPLIDPSPHFHFPVPARDRVVAQPQPPLGDAVEFDDQPEDMDMDILLAQEHDLHGAVGMDFEFEPLIDEQF
ncbi:hypothetical protein L195_g049690, partial [Trifolium pratense]